MLYKALGFTVWKAARRYLRRRLRRRSGNGSGRRKALVAGGVGVAAVGAAAALKSRSGSSPS